MSFLSPHQASKALANAYNIFAASFSNTRNYAWKEFEILFENIPQNAKVLDIGCGNGRLFDYLKEYKNIQKYTGIDISENLLSIAQERYAKEPSAHFQKKGYLELEEKNTFDVIASIASFHHLPDFESRKTSLEKCYDALTENGFLCMTVWNWKEQKKYKYTQQSAKRRSMWNPFFGKNDGIIPYGDEKIPRYYYAFDIETLRNLFERAGFLNPQFFFSEGGKNIGIIAQKKTPIQKRFWIEKVPFDILSQEDALQKLFAWSEESSGQRKVYTPNPEMIIETKKNQHFLEILQNADLSLADGNGILWASGLKNIPEKWGMWKWGFGFFSLFHYFFARKTYPKAVEKPICGSDVFRIFLESKKGKVFLLGGVEGSAVFLKEKYEHVVGFDDGKVNTERMPEIIEKIKNSGANIVFVALGAPKQEIIIDEYLSKTPNISFAMGVGGSFDFLSGHQKRAPKFFQTTGLEWVYRLWKQPERAGRIWNATGRFIYTVLGS